MRKFTRNSLKSVITTGISRTSFVRVVFDKGIKESLCSRCLCSHSSTTSSK